jgi:cardiolipin synthase A/B
MKANDEWATAQGYTLHNKVGLLRGGQPYFNLLLQLIGQAKHTIHLQTYIYENDETGNAITQALVQAASRGVKVFLLLDGYGSKKIGSTYTEFLKLNGIAFRWFAPIFRSQHYYFGRRLHHKIVVVDAQHSLVAGVNISNRYNDVAGQTAWLDWALSCEGEAAAELHKTCIEVWNNAKWRPGKKLDGMVATPTWPSTTCMVRIRRNDWVRQRMEITKSYLEMFRKAKSHIIMMSSYFLPGRTFRKAMQAAAKRGIRIVVIAAGKSDIGTAKQAERYLYSWLLRNKIELYEYQPHILHGKISSYDGQWVTIGSYNVNNLSTYASVELNMDVLDAHFAGNAENTLQQIIEQQCLRVTQERFDANNAWYQQLWQRINYDVVRVLFFLFTFYFRQRHEQTPPMQTTRHQGEQQ